jgi:folate-dependent tRNA-U54 methylase TrmFO/GidA
MNSPNILTEMARYKSKNSIACAGQFSGRTLPETSVSREDKFEFIV